MSEAFLATGDTPRRSDLASSSRAPDEWVVVRHVDAGACEPALIVPARSTRSDRLVAATSESDGRADPLRRRRSVELDVVGVPRDLDADREPVVVHLTEVEEARV